MTDVIYHALSSHKRRKYTTWQRKLDTTGTAHYSFLVVPSWLRPACGLARQFLVAACSSEDWMGISFSVLLAHDACPFCGAPGYRVG